MKAKNNAVHTIYDDWNTCIDDYEDLFKEIEDERNDGLDEDEREELSDNEKYEIFCDELETWLDAEKTNLDIPLRREVIAIANLGFWNGRASGYSILRNNVNSIFDVGEDYNAWTCDRYNVRGVMVHHDGRHYVLYRVFRDETTDEQRERFLDAIYDGKCNDRMIRRYTRSIAPEVKAVYGWK